MSITIDTRESNSFLQKVIPDRRFLGYKGAMGENYSYDVEVVTKAGQTVRYERKAMLDAIQSFAEGKLDRQARATDCLIVEWDDMALTISKRNQDPKFALLAKNCKKHLWRLAMQMPVVWTTSAEETVIYLRYIEARDGTFPVFKAADNPSPSLPPEGHIIWSKTANTSHAANKHLWRYTAGVYTRACGRWGGPDDGEEPNHKRYAGDKVPKRACKTCQGLLAGVQVATGEGAEGGKGGGGDLVGLDADVHHSANGKTQPDNHDK